MTEQERDHAMDLLERLDKELVEARDRLADAEYNVADIERRIQMTRECFPEIWYANHPPNSA